MMTSVVTKEAAMLKIKQYCAYQERCHLEVRQKLYSFKLYKKEVEEVMAQLIEENYLNEERFAILFAGGKFRMKQWGRVKIKYELKRKQVSDYVVKKALKQINDDDYQRTLNKLADQKIAFLKNEENSLHKRKKVINFLLQKGYEAKNIKEVIDKKIK